MTSDGVRTGSKWRSGSGFLGKEMSDTLGYRRLIQN